MEAKLRLRAELEKTSTPIRSNDFRESIKNFQKGNKELSPVVAAVIKKQKIIVLIAEAIKAIGHPRKGASYQAIKKWIINLQGNNTPTFHRMLKLALRKGLSEGELVKPSHCLNAIGVTGSFKLPKKVEKKPEKKVVKSSTKQTSSTKVKQIKANAKVDGKKVLAIPKTAKVEGKVSAKPGVAKTGQSETKMKKSTNVNKGRNLKKPTKENVEKEKPTKKSKIGKTELITKNRKPKKDPVESRQSSVNKKEATKKVAGKTKKAAGMKKLYASQNVSDQKRKDFSDTELDKNIHRIRPLKSYSSDTELEISKRKDVNSKKNAKAGGRKIPGK